MSKVIKGHNKKVTKKPRDQIQKCNCRKKATCPREGNCQVNDIVYKCDITRLLPKKVYLGLAEGELNTSLNRRYVSRRQHFQVTCGT